MFDRIRTAVTVARIRDGEGRRAIDTILADLTRFEQAERDLLVARTRPASVGRMPRSGTNTCWAPRRCSCSP